MTRIISGKAKSATLFVPKNATTRPTSDRVREAVFSTLESWNAIKESKVLDLYAGTGACGLEALSRGAKEVTFVEYDAKAYRVCKNNSNVIMNMMSLPNNICELYRYDSIKFIKLNMDKEWDLIIIDPPYNFPNQVIEECILNASKVISENGIIVLERSKKSEKPEFSSNLNLIKSVSYGETKIYYFEKI